jgi:hypothetical protein
LDEVMMTTSLSPPASLVLDKLRNVLGEAKANASYEEVLREAGLAGLETPQDRLRFGNVLILRGGLLEAIGRAIKIQAILHGARE